MLTRGFLSIPKDFSHIFPIFSHTLFTFHVMLSIFFDVKVLKLPFFFVLKFFHSSVLLDASSILSHSFKDLTCTYIFGDSTRENLWLFSLLVYSVCPLFAPVFVYLSPWPFIAFEKEKRRCSGWFR